MKNSNKLLLGFLAGAAAGAGLYALLKSNKGQEIIGKVKTKAGQWRHDMEDLLHRHKQTAETRETAGDIHN